MDKTLGRANNLILSKYNEKSTGRKVKPTDYKMIRVGFHVKLVQYHVKLAKTP